MIKYQLHCFFQDSGDCTPATRTKNKNIQYLNSMYQPLLAKELCELQGKSLATGVIA